MRRKRWRAQAAVALGCSPAADLWCAPSAPHCDDATSDVSGRPKRRELCKLLLDCTGVCKLRLAVPYQGVRMAGRAPLESRLHAAQLDHYMHTSRSVRMFAR